MIEVTHMQTTVLLFHQHRESHARPSDHHRRTGRMEHFSTSRGQSLNKALHTMQSPFFGSALLIFPRSGYDCVRLPPCFLLPPPPWRRPLLKLRCIHQAEAQCGLTPHCRPLFLAVIIGIGALEGGGYFLEIPIIIASPELPRRTDVPRSERLQSWVFVHLWHVANELFSNNFDTLTPSTVKWGHLRSSWTSRKSILAASILKSSRHFCSRVTAVAQTAKKFDWQQSWRIRDCAIECHLRPHPQMLLNN